jgi:hypothetical protein
MLETNKATIVAGQINAGENKPTIVRGQPMLEKNK